MTRTAIALLSLLAASANAQGGVSVFHDATARVTGSARTDANGVTRFYDAMGRTTGTARTNSNGVTTFHDAAGRVPAKALELLGPPQPADGDGAETGLKSPNNLVK